jgi:hypothetical protein
VEALGDTISPDLPAFLSMHWGWLLAASIVEEFVRTYFHWQRFSFLNIVVIWSFLQAGWLLQVDRTSKALYWYAADLMFNVVDVFVPDHFWPLHFIGHTASIILGVIWMVAEASIGIAGIFVFRHEMQRYFNDKDNVGLSLSGWMTFFFSTLYFQYHFHDISEFKRRQAENITPIAG